MTSPFAAMRFCYSWRDYQAQVLSELDSHLDDDKLHVCAAPGAGKTVLGLEVIRRLDQPTLVLAPSIAIRNQWVDRLKQLFLDGDIPNWVSKDLSDPKPLTIVTYQALQADENIQGLKAAEIKIIVLDEAHHLRRAWWEVLDHTVAKLNARTVALTATPPYDVSSVEWQRYNALCGPLDAEISVPELVRSGDLAPHQDLVHHTVLKDATAYFDLDRANAKLRDGLRAREDMCDMILAHPWVTAPRLNIEALLSQPQLFSAMLVYLSDAGRPIPEEALHILGVGETSVPEINDAWLEHLCQGLLEHLPIAVIAHIKDAGALYRNRISIPLKDDEDRQRVLRNAAEKFQSVREIVELERGLMGDGLRMAILCEYVGGGAIKLAAQQPDYYQPAALETRIRIDPRIGRLDAGSVFERLRLFSNAKADLAVLTGSLIVVPKGSIRGEGITAEPLPHDLRYERVTLSGGAANRRVSLVSNLVSQGVVRVLIGTRALLGQGWDLPVLNTLVLATNVSSFVSSNQIRGRAIRRDPATPDKAANIWHIATVPPDGTGPELAALRDRFDTFVHLDVKAGQIRSGFDEFAALERMNNHSVERAAERGQLAERWRKALITGGANPHIRHRLETRQTIGGLVRVDAAAKMVPRLGVAGGIVGGWAVLSGDPLVGAAAVGAASISAAGALPHFRRILAHGTLAGSLRQTGRALLHAMIEMRLVRTSQENLSVDTGQTVNGMAYCTLSGGTLPEETRFLALLEEFFTPIENPRYILLRESYLGRHVRVAPYPVPRDLGRTKEAAAALLDGWQRYVGPAKLIYTRTVAGRLSLLQMRTIALAEARGVRRSSVWA